MTERAKNIGLTLAEPAIMKLKFIKAPPKAAKRYFLEVPFDSEVHQALYSGSACYLYVPDLIFPRAKPKLGR